MVFRQIQITNDQASKVRGYGPLTYQLWVDDAGAFYVRIVDNEAAGTVPSSLLFSVSQYASKRKSKQSLGVLTGYRLLGGEPDESHDSDGGGFLKAVLCHLLDGEAAA